MIRLVPKAAPITDVTWREVSGLLASALAQCGAIETLTDIYRSLQDRTRQLWLVDANGLTTGVVVTEVYETARGMTCAVPYAAGRDMIDVIDAALASIEVWARQEGCTRLEADGRPGWARALKKHGWEPRLVRMAKELT